MIPNMFKIAGELTPFVMHVAARTVATHALSIFGDHSDVMAARTTGFAMLCSSSVQEAQDLALVAHAATLEARVPFLHFFDGFRTSHEVDKIEPLDDDGPARDDRRRARPRAPGAGALAPTIRCCAARAQNPDVFFQAREAANPFHLAVPDIVQRDDGPARRAHRPAVPAVRLRGHPEAERVIVADGLGSGAVEEAVEALVARGERVGAGEGPAVPAVLRRGASSRRCRTTVARDRGPRSDEGARRAGRAALPGRRDRARRGGREAGPVRGGMPRVIGGRYGLSSKEFTPAMAAAVFDELAADEPKNHFTVGIVDDVTHTEPAGRPHRSTTEPRRRRARGLLRPGQRRHGRARTGTRSRSSASDTELHAQGYFVYDSKKAGRVTVSHLRFGPRPIRSTYLIRQASFVACHEFERLERTDVLAVAAPGATFLLNSPFGPDEVWDRLPVEVQEQIVDKGLRFFVVDGYAVAKEAGLGHADQHRAPDVFLRAAGVLPGRGGDRRDQGRDRSTYGKRGETVLDSELRRGRRRGRRPARGDRPVDARCDVATCGRPSPRRRRTSSSG